MTESDNHKSLIDMMMDGLRASRIYRLLFMQSLIICMFFMMLTAAYFLLEGRIGDRPAGIRDQIFLLSGLMGAFVLTSFIFLLTRQSSPPFAHGEIIGLRLALSKLLIQSSPTEGQAAHALPLIRPAEYLGRNNALAIIMARFAVEDSLRRVAKARGIDIHMNPSSFSDLLLDFRNEELMDKKIFRACTVLEMASNLASHGKKFPTEIANDIIRMGHDLDILLRQDAIRPAPSETD